MLLIWTSLKLSCLVECKDIKKQVLTNYNNLSRFCFLETTPVLASKVLANENPKVETRSRESKPGP